MSRKLQDEILGYRIQNQKDISNGNYNTGQQQNRKRTRQDEFRGFTRIYPIFHTLVQQEEIWEITGIMWIGPWNKLNWRSTKGTEYKSIYNDYQRGKSIKLMVKQTTKDRINHGIKVKICSTMFLHSKER